MGRPVTNGLVELVELVDQKSHDRGFFCMRLAAFINEEKEQQLQLDPQDLWELRFSEAKSGHCAYKHECSIYARTIGKRSKKPFQLSLNFS